MRFGTEWVPYQPDDRVALINELAGTRNMSTTQATPKSLAQEVYLKAHVFRNLPFPLKTDVLFSVADRLNNDPKAIAAHTACVLILGKNGMENFDNLQLTITNYIDDERRGGGYIGKLANIPILTDADFGPDKAFLHPDFAAFGILDQSVIRAMLGVG